MLRGDAAAALSAAEALERLGREHGMAFWRIRAELHAGWARGRLHDAAAGAAEIRRAQAALADQGATANAWFYNVLLAELRERRWARTARSHESTRPWLSHGTSTIAAISPSCIGCVAKF
jgi:hypothetical protein